MPIPPDLLARIRAALAEAEKRTSLRQLAADVGMSPTGLRKFMDGAEPYRTTEEKLQSWFVRDAAAKHQVDETTVAAAAVVLAGPLPELGPRLLVMVCEAYRQAGIPTPKWLEKMADEG